MRWRQSSLGYIALKGSKRNSSGYVIRTAGIELRCALAKVKSFLLGIWPSNRRSATVTSIVGRTGPVCHDTSIPQLESTIFLCFCKIRRNTEAEML